MALLVLHEQVCAILCNSFCLSVSLKLRVLLMAPDTGNLVLSLPLELSNAEQITSILPWSPCLQNAAETFIKPNIKVQKFNSLVLVCFRGTWQLLCRSPAELHSPSHPEESSPQLKSVPQDMATLLSCFLALSHTVSLPTNCSQLSHNCQRRGGP